MSKYGMLIFLFIVFTWLGYTLYTKGLTEIVIWVIAGLICLKVSWGLLRFFAIEVFPEAMFLFILIWALFVLAIIYRLTVVANCSICF